MSQAQQRNKMDFPTNVPQVITLGKNFWSGEGKFGMSYGWNVMHDGEEKVMFIKDALHTKIEGHPEGTKLRIVYKEKKRDDGKVFHEWEVFNGSQPPQAPPQRVQTAKSSQSLGATDGDVYSDHVLSCAELAGIVSAKLDINDPAAIQACFATIVIDTKNRNILLPKPKTLYSTNEPSEPEENPFDDLEDVPF
jgi:hypothetical protein